MDGYTQGHVERKKKTFYFVYPKSTNFVPDTEKCPFLWLFLLRYLLMKHEKTLILKEKRLDYIGKLSQIFIGDMGKDPGILELFSIPSIERLKLFIPREYEQERTDWYLRSSKENLPMLKWLELEMPAHEFHIETLEGLELRHFGVTGKTLEL